MDNHDIVVPDGEVSYASGRGNKSRCGQHLYVMQAASGRIKIGRSSDPLARRRHIQAAIGQPLFLLKVFKNRGAEERAILAKVEEWHEFGEWFSNTGLSRMAIRQAIGVPIGFRVFEKLPLGESIVRASASMQAEAALEAMAAAETAAGGRSRRCRIIESRETVRARWHDR